MECKIKRATEQDKQLRAYMQKSGYINNENEDSSTKVAEPEFL